MNRVDSVILPHIMAVNRRQMLVTRDGGEPARSPMTSSKLRVPDVTGGTLWSMFAGRDAEALDRRRNHARQAGTATGIALSSIAVLIPVAPRLIVSMAVTMVVCALSTAWLRGSYLELLERLATDSDAYSIPAVRAFGERLVRIPERRNLAGMIDELISQIGHDHTLASSERLTAYRTELSEIARGLCDVHKTPRPTIVACCRRLLVRAAESPLYNERIPIEELHTVVLHIRLGLAAASAVPA